MGTQRGRDEEDNRSVERDVGSGLPMAPWLVSPHSLLEPRAETPPWVVLASNDHGLITELATWGTRIIVPLSAEIAVAETLSFEVRDHNRSHVECRGRVIGLVDYDRGREVLLWVVDDSPRWRELAERFRTRFDPDARPAGEPDRRLPTDRIERRLRALTGDRSRALVRSLGEGADHDMRLAARLDPERGLLMEWDPRWAEISGPYEICVEGPFSTITFVEDSLTWQGPPLATELHQTRQRQMRRVAAPSGARVILAGLDSDDPYKTYELKLLDVSFGGVAAALDPSLPHLQRGSRVPEVVVTWKGGPGLRFEGSVRHRSASTIPDQELIGLQLSGAPDAQRERWAREVENLLYPTTRSFGHNYQSIWDLFEASGYFDLSGGRRETLDFQLLRSAFENAYFKLASAPDLGCMVSFESPTRVEATLAGLRVWSKSWFGLQMARNADRPHLVNSDSAPLRDIHFHVYERAGANDELDWLVGYVRDDAGFSKVLHREFVLTMPGAVGVPFEVWRFPVTMMGDPFISNVHTATDEQISELLRRLVDLRPRAYLEAHDLLPETFHQEALRDDWYFHGLMRERSALVAMERGRIVAVAILDAVENGLHLYGLLDAVRLFELEPGGRYHFPSLLLTANEWFYTLGKSNFVCFDEEGHAEVMRSMGAKSLGTGMVTMLPRISTPDLLERISELAAPKK